MEVKKNTLRAVLFVLAMSVRLCSYSQSDFTLTSGVTMTYDERQQEIFRNAKTCAGVENIRIIQSTNYEMVWEWIDLEVANLNRKALIRLNQETGVYMVVSLQKTKEELEGKKVRKSKKSKEETAKVTEILDKVQTCFASEAIRAIETTNAEILQKWIKAEDENRNITTNFNAETGVYTAVSSPKNSGNGKVLFRKMD